MVAQVICHVSMCMSSPRKAHFLRLKCQPGLEKKREGHVRDNALLYNWLSFCGDPLSLSQDRAARCGDRPDGGDRNGSKRSSVVQSASKPPLKPIGKLTATLRDKLRACAVNGRVTDRHVSDSAKPTGQLREIVAFRAALKSHSHNR
jgi:hypothetical protein